MEPEWKEKVKRAIGDRIAAVKEDIASFKQLTGPVAPDNAIGRLTRMEAIGSRSINEAALAKARLALSKLERSLAAIDHPDFGLCRDCEEPISPARLLALPETDLCIRCAENRDGQ